ncbi:MAG: nucleotidyltransferase domain-containing protein, partial [Lachnospiraceae bacterium]|nr:nucleotidyltransferase domain-containing protein [Lachnospiraceae bacterium]
MYKIFFDNIQKLNVPVNIKNLIIEFVNNIGIDRIDGVALQGGYAREIFNEDSDIDLVFYFENKEKGQYVKKGYSNYEGKIFEIKHLYGDKIDSKKWKDKQKYVYINETVILYDRNMELIKIIDNARMNKKE